MSRNRIIVAVLAFVALSLGWYFGSPRWTLYQMGNAAEAKDSEKLASYIDFPTLRESTKSQLRVQMMKHLTEAKEENGFAALGAMVGMAMIDPMIDALLTPEAMQAAFDKEPNAAAETKAKERRKTEGASKKKPFDLDTSDMHLVQKGVDEFRLRKKGSQGEEGDLIFRRHGFGWKLSELRLPKGAKAPKLRA